RNPWRWSAVRIGWTSNSHSLYLGSSLPVASLISLEESLWRAGAGVEAAALFVSAAVAVPEGPSTLRFFAFGSGTVVAPFSLARSTPSVGTLGGSALRAASGIAPPAPASR